MNCDLIFYWLFNFEYYMRFFDCINGDLWVKRK